MICVYIVILFCIYLSPLMDLGDWIGKYVMLLNTIAMCISPMFPVSLVMGQATAAKRLQNDHEIQCLQPGRIPIAGKISTIVFDKTGTITKDGMDFDSVIPVDDSSKLGDRVKIDPDRPEANPDKIDREVPELVRHALAACHTVTTLPDKTLVGNAVECAMVAAAGWEIREDSVSRGSETLPLVKKLDFDHKRMTSGVIVKTATSLVVYIKGSYEKIEAISKKEAVPANYGSVTEQCAKDGYYVLGIAYKTLPLSAEATLTDMGRDEIEEGLSICGLILFRNEMKKDSPQAMRELEEGGIKSVICTGDNALTGVSIGRECGIVKNHDVLLGEIGQQSGMVEWRDPDNSAIVDVDPFHADYRNRELAVTQGAWRYFHKHPGELKELIDRMRVFARMKPEEKINVVKFFQGMGLVVGMSGDGGNDCGGLRAAHAGLALSDAEASMVSPFATGRDQKSLLTMVDLIREGRACLATNIATFTSFMVYCFTLTTIRTVLGVESALSFGEFVWFLMDVGINIILVGTMTTSGPTEKLGKYRPTATLLGPRTLIGIAYPYVSSILFFGIARVMVSYQDFYTETGGVFDSIADIGLLSQFWMLRGDNYVSPIGFGFLFLTLITTAFVNTYGGEFRKNIVHNWGMFGLHGFFLLFVIGMTWTQPNRLNCVFRYNCDTTNSLAAGGLESDTALVRGFWETIAFWSAGGLGDCFMGPQIKTWQPEWQTWVTATDADTAENEGAMETTDNLTIPWQWLPNKNAQYGSCFPGYLEDKAWKYFDENPGQTPTPIGFTPDDDPVIEQVEGCTGANNCYPVSFKLLLSLLYALHMIGHHCFVQFVLHGTFVSRLREKKESSSVELQTPLVVQNS